MAAAASQSVKPGQVLVMLSFQGEPTEHKIVRIVSAAGGFPQITATFLPSDNGFDYPLSLKVTSSIETTGQVVSLPVESLKGLQVERYNQRGDLERSPVKVDNAQLESLRLFFVPGQDRQEIKTFVSYQLIISHHAKSDQFKGNVKKLAGDRLLEAQRIGLSTQMHFIGRCPSELKTAQQLLMEPPEDLTHLTVDELLSRLEKLKDQIGAFRTLPDRDADLEAHKEEYDRVMSQFRQCSDQLDRKLKQLKEATQALKSKKT